MRTVRFSRTLPPAWAGTHAVALGAVPTGSGTPDLYALVSAASAPDGYVALHADDTQLYAYQQALVVDDLVFLGFGHDVHVVPWPEGPPRTHRLAAYFVSLHRAVDAVYVASGEDVLRLTLDGDIVWTSPQVAIDGVRIELVTAEHVIGEAEHDPPGDWRPFRLRTSDGRPA